MLLKAGNLWQPTATNSHTSPSVLAHVPSPQETSPSKQLAAAGGGESGKDTVISGDGTINSDGGGSGA